MRNNASSIKKLWVPASRDKKSGKNIENLLPKKTLCKEDFLKDDIELSKRALAVAKELGDTTARGRIGSLNMMIEGVDTFEKWWRGAAPAEKSRLLADKKHHDSFVEDDHIRLDKVLLNCPFRGPVPSPSQEEEKEEVQKPKKVFSSQALVPKKKGDRS